MAGFYSDIAAAQADGLVHYWTMNGADGDAVIVDQIGGFNGALVSNFTGNAADTIEATPLLEGRRGRLDGTNSTGFATWECDPAAASLPSAQHWNATCRLRIKFDTYADLHANGCMAITIGGYSSNTGQLVFFLRNLTGSNPMVKWSRPNNAIEGPINPNDWVELVAVSEGDANGCTIKLYANGAQVASAAVSAGRGGINPTAGKLYISNFAPGNAWAADAVVDDVGFWGRALSAAEISALYNSGNARSIIHQVVKVSNALAMPWSAYNNTAGQVSIAWRDMAEFSQVPEITAIDDVLFYRCILTGAADGLADLILPMSSFNARLRSGRDSYLSVIVQGGRSIIEGIEGRANGDLVVEQVVGGAVTEFCRVNFAELRVDEGSAGTALSLSGTKQKTYTEQANWIFKTYAHYSRAGNKSRIRMQANAAVKPGDTINAEGVDFIVDTATIIGSTNRVYMEIAE